MKLEYTEKEFNSMYDLAKQMIQSIEKIAMFGLKQGHEINLKRLELEKMRLHWDQECWEFEHKFAKGRPQGFFEDDTEEQNQEPTTQIPLPNATDNMIYDFTNEMFREPQLTEHQENGKNELSNMLTFWMQNFGDDFNEQPDRATYMEQLGHDGKRAGSVVSYCMAIGGLTKAVWNTWAEWEIGMEKTPENVRNVAGNITQVASCFLGALSDEFEYPNPLNFMEKK